MKEIKDNLTENNKIWHERIIKYISDYKYNEVCGWWLRIEYRNTEENLTTKKVNYQLDKLVKLGLLNRHYAKYAISYSLKKH
jgi:hypothetical protein